jgi:hypothetical protein
MRSIYITLAIIISIFVTGCTSVVTSVKPISLYEAKSNYKILDGIPYFLPKSIIHVDIIWSESDLNWTVGLTPVIIPDEKSRFILRPSSNALFDDNITLTVDSNGLLQTVNTTITDKTVSSLGDLVKAAGNVFALGAAMPTMPTFEKAFKERLRAGEPPKLELVRRSFHGDFDPDVGLLVPSLESPPINKTADPIDQFTAEFKITTERLGTPITSEKSPGETIDRIVEPDSKQGDGTAEIENIHGIVVRIPIPYKITICEKLKLIRRGTSGNAIGESKPIELMQSKIFLLPDTDIQHNCVLPISRRYLVSDQTNVTLKDGMIQTIQLNRPSMVAGVVGIPKTILEALVPIPLQIRQSQVNNLQAIYNTLKTKEDIQKLQSQ